MQSQIDPFEHRLVGGDVREVPYTKCRDQRWDTPDSTRSARASLTEGKECGDGLSLFEEIQNVRELDGLYDLHTLFVDGLGYDGAGKKVGLINCGKVWRSRTSSN